MMKTVLALCLCVGSLADDSVVQRVEKLVQHVEEKLVLRRQLETELNGCGELCADEITLNSIPSATFSPAIQDGTCYVVDGTFPAGTITVPDMVKCAKITVPSGSGLKDIGVNGYDTEIVNEGEVSNYITVRDVSSRTKITNTGTGSDGSPVQIWVISDTTEITVSDGGKAKIIPWRDLTYKCYGEDVTVAAGQDKVCKEPEEFNGCGEYCYDPITISFPTIESDKCYVVDDLFPVGIIEVPDTATCAKITVLSGSRLSGIDVYGNDTEIVNEGEVNFIWVWSSAAGTKITNTGAANSLGEPVQMLVNSATTELTVSDPGKAKIFADGGSAVTFKCYGADVTVAKDEAVVCNGPPPTPVPTVTAAPTKAPTVTAAPTGPPELNGCGEPCADKITISSKPFPSIISDTCYVVDGTFPSVIYVRDTVKCAKITVPSGSTLDVIDVYGNDTEIVNEGEVNFISVYGDGTEIVNDGKVEVISDYSTAGTKITVTGTKSDGSPVQMLVYSTTTEITVSEPGKAFIDADETQTDVTLKCYGELLTVPAGEEFICASP